MNTDKCKKMISVHCQLVYLDVSISLTELDNLSCFDTVGWANGFLPIKTSHFSDLRFFLEECGDL